MNSTRISAGGRLHWRAALLRQVGQYWDVVTLGPSRARNLYRWELIPEPPDKLEPFRVYIVGQGGHQWSAEFLCPCGCGSVIRLSLHPDGRPRWKATMHPRGHVTLAPSIWRKVGCRSHFFLRRGRVEFC